MAQKDKKAFTPSPEILNKYADLMVNFALGQGKGIKRGDVVRVLADQRANAREGCRHAHCVLRSARSILGL